MRDILAVYAPASDRQISGTPRIWLTAENAMELTQSRKRQTAAALPLRLVAERRPSPRPEAQLSRNPWP